MSSEREPGASPAGLLAGFSLEMTGKDAGHLERARGTIPPGTRINVTFLAGEDLQARVTAAAAVREYGFTPVPHVAARRIGSERALEEFLAALRTAGASENLFVIAGDPPRPEGPYEDAAALVRSGKLAAFGARRVSIAGYPEGHPEIADDVLWTSLADKARLLADAGLADSIITQFGFDAGAALRWIERVRDQGIGLPVRVGVPGPAGVRRLLRYAARFGVSTSAGIARKYGLSLTSLMSTAGPDAFVRDLADGYDRGRHGEVRLHLYTFGGLSATSEWISEFRSGSQGK
jgi:methylenetetrahydrofolate reductase (NADPH)